ncbi:sigma-70 family RNA polymerase sigma factor [Pseudoalteromonas luteoviolacea]|uniref:RNA polymerase sigma factor n=1 Tax=Pseudoalteromonas luteoviolacea S4054 TaxID=1129367 RepID=A0A0F6A8Y6_9GAMM|nr:sigma-70 family RNA polymerase sigma factor [Pseudoalteromonas luteoviolacea]AOT07064.1 RNA polymerase subunit sigma [Pseudoalteromonas luteoviolacea]AOT11982.1 RNA polymerase subunit sigma [Pseudoalteromonas luteoviolacea]AOT16894.1 RNA polymerase subunit sigma [Pseudoalteromonas luteoviolacea]KKE82608.1 hypothetical protein N479_17510 [Pseudoalteromonas luteoviolacea S4054]KZN69958.1 hypothetical protein N481_21315 [Pseudoalteromonas luteoviolacea S4047-1]
MQIESLYQDHHSWLRQFLYNKLNCQAQAADIAQDTFLRVLNKQAAKKLEPIHSPRAYLTTLATGLVNNHWRRQSIEQAYLETLAQQPEHLVPSPETQQMIIHTLEQLSLVLEKLPQRIRQIFIMARIDGLPYKDIAKQLDVSVNIVQKAMCKAIMACIEVQSESI